MRWEYIGRCRNLSEEFKNKSGRETGWVFFRFYRGKGKESFFTVIGE